MPTPPKGARLGGSAAHERLMLANLATALFEHGRITTTETKARRLRPFAERLITKAKRGDLHARRQVLAVVRDKSVVHTLFSDIGPRYGNRPGGYTRITKIGPRKGDNAPMAVIELVEALTLAQEAVGEAEQARKTRFTRDEKVAATETDTDLTADATAATEPATEPVTEPAGEAGDPPAEDTTSAQTSGASAREQAEGDRPEVGKPEGEPA